MTITIRHALVITALACAFPTQAQRAVPFASVPLNVFSLLLGQPTVAGAYGVAVDPAGYVYGVHEKFDGGGSLQLAEDLVDPFSAPFGLAVDSTGHRFVTDGGLGHVSVFASEGAALGTIGSDN